MEIDDLVSALETTLSFLRESESSFWSSLSVEELISKLEDELHKSKNSQQFDLKQLKFLFAPTGPIQDTSIDNGWGDQYLEISKTIDGYTNAK